MKTAAAYIRVSTEDQTEFSPDSQIKKIQEYAVHNNIVLPKKFIFVDEGISGKYATKRPEFMKMISAAKTKPKPFDLILVWKFSRFARNRQDSIVYKSMLRKDFNIDVISITEQLSKDPTSMLIEALLEAMDEYYSINLAQEVRRGMNEKFSRGGVVSSPPFGYKMGRNNFEPDERNSQVVKMIFDDFTNGMSTREIAVKLNNMGISSKRGNKFENRTVEYILLNPVYIGKLRRNMNGFDKRDRYRTGKDIAFVNGKHTPIIDTKTFESAQNMLLGIKKRHRSDTKRTFKGFMLKGLVRCGNCGATLTQSARGKSLQCNKYAKGQCDRSHSISITKINKAILMKLQTDITGGMLDITLKNANNNSTKNISKILLRKEYRRLERVKLAYENGIDSADEYKINKEKILKRIKGLNREISKSVDNSIKAKSKLKMQLKNVLEKLESTKLSECEKNVILKALIHKITFNRSDNSLQIYYYI